MSFKIIFTIELYQGVYIKLNYIYIECAQITFHFVSSLSWSYHPYVHHTGSNVCVYNFCIFYVFPIHS